MEALEVDPSDCLFALEVESSRALHATGGVFAPWYICSGIVFFFLSLVTFTLARPVAAREGGREGGLTRSVSILGGGPVTNERKMSLSAAFAGQCRMCSLDLCMSMPNRTLVTLRVGRFLSFFCSTVVGVKATLLRPKYYGSVLMFILYCSRKLLVALLATRHVLITEWIVPGMINSTRRLLYIE